MSDIMSDRNPLCVCVCVCFQTLMPSIAGQKVYNFHDSQCCTAQLFASVNVNTDTLFRVSHT